jgi:GNAT superfamily N-acetyltransferase
MCSDSLNKSFYISISDVVPENEELPYAEILHLLHLSFNEYLKQGIVFTVSNFTIDSLKTKLVGATIVMLYHDSKLVGFSALYQRTRHNKKYAEGELVAVDPNYRRKGIAKLMLEKRVEIAKSHGCLWMEEDTSVYAKQSIDWHLKTGYQIVGLESYSSSAYYSYIFRYYFDGKKHKIANTISYTISYIITKFCKCEDGSLTKFGILIKKLMQRCKN